METKLDDFHIGCMPFDERTEAFIQIYTQDLPITPYIQEIWFQTFMKLILHSTFSISKMNTLFHPNTKKENIREVFQEYKKIRHFRDSPLFSKNIFGGI